MCIRDRLCCVEPTFTVSGNQPVTAPTHRGDRVTVLGPGSPRLLVFIPGAFTPLCSGEIRELGELALRIKIAHGNPDELDFRAGTARKLLAVLQQKSGHLAPNGTGSEERDFHGALFVHELAFSFHAAS